MDPTAQTELLVQQGTLAGMAAQLDLLDALLPPPACVWQGPAHDAYADQVLRLQQGLVMLREHVSAARSAVARALAS